MQLLVYLVYRISSHCLTLLKKYGEYTFGQRIKSYRTRASVKQDLIITFRDVY